MFACVARRRVWRAPRSQFIKEPDTCNRMTCPSCKTDICYVCRVKLPAKVRYKHFCMCDCTIATDGLITRVGKRNEERCPKCHKCALWHVDSELPELPAIDKKRKPKKGNACVIS